jgi:hypothetical protein
MSKKPQWSPFNDSDDYNMEQNVDDDNDNDNDDDNDD